MNNTLKQIVNMKAALWVNAFVYYFKRLWVIGKFIPDSLFFSYTAKKVLNVAFLVIKQIFDFFTKPFYLIIAIGLPLIAVINNQPQLAGQEYAVMGHMLFFLSCYVGPLGDSRIFTVSRDKIAFIKYMHMNAREYTKCSLAFCYIPFFLYYLPWMIAAALLFGQTAWRGISAWLMLICFRMAGEALQLFVFDRTGKVMSRNMGITWAIILTGLLLAYLLPFQGFILPGQLLFHPVAVILYVLLGGYSIYYITAGYAGYEKKLPRSIDLNFLLSNIMKVSSGSSFKEVEIKEKDLNLDRNAGNSFRNLRGYAYMNALFFARHRRQLLRPVYYRLIITGIIFAGSIIFYRSSPEAAVALSRNLSASLLPSFVFIMYGLTIADKACRAMFYNCDKDMLHYAYYRNPRTILQNFRARLLRVSLFNSIVAIALCLAAIGFCLICGTSIFTLDMLLFCITILLLSILFTAHHLCLYYIFQPYSESLKVKNPFFSVFNVAMYLLCFLCLEVRVGGPVFTLAVLIFTVVYIITVLIFVYYRAPQSFRVK